MKKVCVDFVAVVGLLFFVVSCVNAADTGDPNSAKDGFGQEAIFRDAENFFGSGAEGLADVVAKIFKEHGRPDGYIKGEEGGGAIVVGLRYGHGVLVLKNGVRQKIYWQSPSIGLDFGGNMSKSYILIYGLDELEKIFRKFPGVDGSFYVIGGMGLNYVQSDNIVLAPIRIGVGFRAGIAAGYLKFSREKVVNPF